MRKEEILYINDFMNMMAFMIGQDIVIKMLHEKILKNYLFSMMILQ